MREYHSPANLSLSAHAHRIEIETSWMTTNTRQKYRHSMHNTWHSRQQRHQNFLQPFVSNKIKKELFRPSRTKHCEMGNNTGNKSMGSYRNLDRNKMKIGQEILQQYKSNVTWNTTTVQVELRQVYNVKMKQDLWRTKQKDHEKWCQHTICAIYIILNKKSFFEGVKSIDGEVAVKGRYVHINLLSYLWLAFQNNFKRTGHTSQGTDNKDYEESRHETGQRLESMLRYVRMVMKRIHWKIYQNVLIASKKSTSLKLLLLYHQIEIKLGKLSVQLSVALSNKMASMLTFIKLL